MKPHPQEMKDAAEQLINDGASLREAARTIGVHHKTVSKWFPGRGWSLSEAGKFAMLLRKEKEL